MTTGVITIGVALMKMGVLGGVGAVVITGIKWFGKFDPKLNGKKDRGGSESDDVRKSLRKRVAERG